MADIRSILDPLPVDKSVKAAAWDAFHAAKSPEEFRATFDRLNIPQQTKAALWDARFAGGQQQAAPAPAPAPQPVPGADAPSVLDPKPAPKSAGQATSDFLGGAWSMASPITAVKGLAQAVMHPIDTASGIVQAHADTADRAAQSMQSGDYLQGVRHAINTLIPLIGPMLDQSQEKVREGNTAEGLGEIVGMAAAPAVLRGTAQAGKAAAQGAKAAVGAVRRNPALANAALGTVSPRAAAAVDVVNEIRAMRNPPPAAPRPGAAPPAPAASTPATWDYSAPPQTPARVQASAPSAVPETPAPAPVAEAAPPARMGGSAVAPEPYAPVDPTAGLDPAIVQQMRARRAALDAGRVPPEMRPQPEPAPMPVEALAPDPLGVRPLGNESAGLADIPATGAEKIKRARARVKAKEAESFDARLSKLVAKSRKMEPEPEAKAAAGVAEEAPPKFKGEPKLEPTDAELADALQRSLDEVHARKLSHRTGVPAASTPEGAPPAKPPKPKPAAAPAADEDLTALLQQSIDAVNARKGGAAPVAEAVPEAPTVAAVPESAPASEVKSTVPGWKQEYNARRKQAFDEYNSIGEVDVPNEQGGTWRGSFNQATSGEWSDQKWKASLSADERRAAASDASKRANQKKNDKAKEFMDSYWDSSQKAAAEKALRSKLYGVHSPGDVMRITEQVQRAEQAMAAARAGKLVDLEGFSPALKKQIKEAMPTPATGAENLAAPPAKPVRAIDRIRAARKERVKANDANKAKLTGKAAPEPTPAPDPLGVRPLGREAEAVADLPKVDAPKAAKPSTGIDWSDADNKDFRRRTGSETKRMTEKQLNAAGRFSDQLPTLSKGQAAKRLDELFYVWEKSKASGVSMRKAWEEWEAR